MPEIFTTKKLIGIVESDENFSDFITRLSKMSTKELGKLVGATMMFDLQLGMQIQTPVQKEFVRKNLMLMKEAKNILEERRS